MNFQSRLEIGRVDFQSLEPIDLYNRPFRFKLPNTTEYARIMEKLTLEEFNIRSANCLKTFKFAVGSLERSNISRLIQKIEDLSEFSLHNLIKERLYYYNQMLNKIYHRLGINVKNSIISDKLVSRDYWIPFLIYTMIFGYLFNTTKKLEYLEVFPKYNGLIYRLIAVTSFQVLNKTMKKKHWLHFMFKGRFDHRKYLVNNIWSELGVDETISPYLPFIQRDKFKKLFCNYEINELGDRSYFNQMHRNKIIFHYIKSAISVYQLKEENIIQDFFFFHNRYVKDGKSNLFMFDEVLEDLEDIVLNKNLNNKEDLRIKSFFRNVKNFGESNDFVNKPLNYNMKYNWFNPMYINESPVVDYFGEKIGLMFYFISYYGMKKNVFIFFTTIFYIVLNFTPVKDLTIYKYLQFAQMVIINIYSLNFYERWNQQENLFAMKYGQDQVKEEKETRVNFKGYYSRNLASNQMNELNIDLKQVFWKRLLIHTINAFLLLISIAVSFGVILLKNYLGRKFFVENSDHTFTISSNIAVFQYLLVILNAIIVELLNFLYDLIYVKMTDYENYSDLKEYEYSLLIKRFSFKLINMFNSMVIIAFLKGGFPLVFGTCSDFGISMKGTTKCFTELRIQGKTG
jgi:hypothetical protein